jgi:hypothetical protein
MLPALDQTIPVAQMVRFAIVNDGGRAAAGSTFPTEKRRINETLLVRCKSSDYLLWFDNRPISKELNFINMLLLLG